MDEMTDGMLNYRTKKDVMIDFNYRDQCIIELLRNKFDRMRSKFLGFLPKFKIKVNNIIYRYLIEK